MKVPAIFLCLLAFLTSVSQVNVKSLSRAEKWWAFKYPFAAKKAKKISVEVIEYCNALAQKDSFCGSDLNGGKLDAYRHTYWMARLCEVMKPRKAYSLGFAHEKGNRQYFKKHKEEDGVMPDSMMTVMDLVNNQIGIEVGTWLAWNPSSGEYSIEKTRQVVMERLKTGDLRILLKDEDGNFRTCDKKKIDMNKYKGKWNVPKCLVKSSTTLRQAQD